MANINVHYSSMSSEWETPKEFFEKIDDEFNFTLDVCATPDNAKCTDFFDVSTNGLNQDWIGTVWCNPPYGRGIKDWVRKAAYSRSEGVTTVMLIPARTDTKYFHQYIYDEEFHQPYFGVQIRFIKGRIHFNDSKEPAPFPSMLVVFKGIEFLEKSVVIQI